MVDKLNVTKVVPVPNIGKTPPQSMANAKQVAQDFEAMFISNMYNLLFEQIEVDPLTGGGQAEAMFRSLLINEYANNISETASFGITEKITAQLLSLQEST